MLKLRSIVRSLCPCHQLGWENVLETMACLSRQLYRTVNAGNTCDS